MHIVKHNAKVDDTSIQVVCAGRSSFYITLDGIAVECAGNLDKAVNIAKQYEELATKELQQRREYAQNGSYYSL